MNETLEHIIGKFELQIGRTMPIEIPNINRAIMAETMQELSFKSGAEIGVAQGNHSRLLCEKIPGLKLFCVDVWKRYKGYLEYTDSIEEYHKIAIEQLAQYNCTFIEKFSMDAVKDFEDRSLDFVYIDGAHDFKNVADDMCEWTKKVRVGGIVFGHDYKRPEGRYVVDVKDVVPAYCYAKRIKPWFVLGQTGRNDGQFREGVQSWMFVRQETDKL